MTLFSTSIHSCTLLFFGLKICSSLQSFLSLQNFLKPASTQPLTTFVVWSWFYMPLHQPYWPITLILQPLRYPHYAPVYILSIHCAIILFLDNPMLDASLCSIQSQLILLWTIHTHHLLGSQCGNNVAAFQLVLVLTWDSNFESSEQSLKINIPNPKELHLPQLGHLVINDYNTSHLSCCHLPSSIGTPGVCPNNAVGIPYVMASYNNPYHTKQLGQSAVYHPNFTCPNQFTCTPPSSMMFRHFFGIPYTSPMGGNYVRPMTLCKVLGAFGIPKQTAHLVAQEAVYQTTLLSSFPCLLQPHLAQVIADAVVHHILFPLVDTKDTPAGHIPHCLLLTTNTSCPVPSDKTWLSFLHSNPDTLLMLSKLAANPLYIWLEKEIQQISAVWRPPTFVTVASHSHDKDSLLPNPSPHTRIPSSSSLFQSPFGMTSLVHTMDPLCQVILAHSKPSVEFALISFDPSTPQISNFGWPPVHTALLYNPVVVYQARSVSHGSSQPHFPSCM